MIVRPMSETEAQAFEKLSPFAQATVRECNHNTNETFGYLAGRLLTFIDALGGTDQVTKSRKDVIKGILSDVQNDMHDRNRFIGDRINRRIQEIKDPTIKNSDLYIGEFKEATL